MTEDCFNRIKLRVLKKLEGLCPDLTYHSIAHTLDVLYHSERIALEEGIVCDRELFLLKVAALYHDTGFLVTYTGHEWESCEIFLKDAAAIEFSPEEKERVTNLILVTKMPHEPVTLLQKIICDADLDYLGRPDFFGIAEKLKQEFLHYRIVESERDWMELQLNFFKNHTYYTNASVRLREPVKQLNFQRLL